MTIRTEVNDSLLIAASTAGVDGVADSNFVKGINQVVEGVLQPVSTISAADNAFYYTYDAKADGSKNNSTDTDPYVLVQDNKITVNTTDYKAYVDYVFEIKAINAAAAAKDLNLTKLNLLYDGAQVTEHTYRVAIFTQDEATSGNDKYETRPDAENIFAYTGFAYFDNTAVKNTTTKDSVSPVVNNAGWTRSVAKQSTKYYKLTVRLWLEGEDTDCFTSKFLNLTENWTLDLAFELVDANGTPAAVSAIGSAAYLTASETSGTISISGNIPITTSTNETITGYQWYNAATHTAVSGATSATYAPTDDGSYYCVVTTSNNTKYQTNTVTVDVA